MMDQKWTTKINHSIRAQERWEELCETYDDFGFGYDLDYTIIEGNDLPNTVFVELGNSPVWTFFWTGDQYLFFPKSERELLKLLNDEEQSILNESEEEINYENER